MVRKLALKSCRTSCSDPGSKPTQDETITVWCGGFLFFFSWYFSKHISNSTHDTYSLKGISGKKLPKPLTGGFSKKPMQRVFDWILFSPESHSTSKRRSEHPLAARNTEQTILFPTTWLGVEHLLFSGLQIFLLRNNSY